MQTSLFTFSWIVLLPLGVALRWTLHLIYGAQRNRRDDNLLLILSTAAWLLMMAGVVGPLIAVGGIFSLLLIVAFFFVAEMVVGKYRDAQRRTLLWALAVAADRDLPLHEAARAFAADRCDEIGRRADCLADLLEAGVDLPEALKQSKNPLPIDAELAARLSHAAGPLKGALREAAGEGGRYNSLWESLLQRLIYFEVLVLVIMFMASFLMIKIVPTYATIFEDFDMQLPVVTQWAISASRGFVNYWFLFAPLMWALLLLMCYGIAFACGGVRWEPPGVSWFTRRYHGAMVLRSLAQPVQRKCPLDRTLGMLAQWYPRGHVRRRLDGVTLQVTQGNDWCHALRESGLIGEAEAAVLRSAERVGNLPWALREMSESILRRIAYRVGFVLSLCIPGIILAIGACVGVYAVAFIFPLMELVSGLA
jgi:type II secretory pathway component PulF